MSKRAKFIFTPIVLSLGLISVNFLDNDLRFAAIGLLTLATLILFYYSLREGIRKDATLLTLILPTMFTAGVGFFWFLLPANLLARLPITIFYGLGLYALVSTSNIFIVSTIRKIPLSRAAKGVGFVLTLLTSFFLFDAVLSLRLPAYGVGILIFIISVPLFLQGLWVGKLERNLSREVIEYSIIMSTVVTQLAILLFFWPTSVVVGSLFLTVAIYVLLGLGQAKLEDRLFKKTIREYVLVGVIVFIAVFFATHWS
jgi:hypothetical protein